MVMLRKVTLAVMLAASLAVLALAVYLFSDYRQAQYLLDNSKVDGGLPELHDRIETLSRRIGDAELLVVILLGASGLYAIVFALSSLSSATSFARQADRSIAAIRSQLGAAMSELRELQEEASTALHAEPHIADEQADRLRRQLRAIVREEIATGRHASPNMEAEVDSIVRQIATWNIAELDSQAKLELRHYERAAAYLELTRKPQLGASLAGLYRRFAELYAASDKAQQRFYLNRALSLAPPDSQSVSEIHYDLACWFADNRDFSHALGELTLAFQHQSKALDDRLSKDIDEGGRLSQLASTPPFEKALNDLLLKMSIGIG